MILSAWISAPRRIAPDFMPPGRLQTGPAAARMRELNWNPSVRFSRFLRTKKDACGADAPTVSRTGSRPPFRDQDPYPDRSEHPRRMHPALVLFVLPVPPPAVPGTSIIYCLPALIGMQESCIFWPAFCRSAAFRALPDPALTCPDPLPRRGLRAGATFLHLSWEKSANCAGSPAGNLPPVKRKKASPGTEVPEKA